MANIFNKPVAREIAGVPVTIQQVPFSHFEQAITLGEWFDSMSNGSIDFTALRESLQPGHPRRQALLELLQTCIYVQHKDGNSMLSIDELGAMPVPAMAEAVVEVMEVNADFFFQTLPRLQKTAERIAQRVKPTGTGSSSSSSAPATSSTTSPATA